MMEKELNDYIEEFYIAKTKMKEYKEYVDSDNEKIKQLMQENNLTNFETENELIAKLGTQKRESFNEEKLIQKLKDLNGFTAIKTKEYVDMDELENLIYNGHIDAGQLTDCRQTKEIITLKVNKKKGV